MSVFAPRAYGLSHQNDQIRSIRILPELRAVQVERAMHMTPARTIFLGEKYDLGGTVLPASMEKLTLRTTIVELFRAKETVLELPEPLWLRFLPKAVVLSLAWRAGGFVSGRHRETVTYAIENNNLESVLFGRRRPLKFLSGMFRIALRIYISLSFDRIAFGSAGARNSYESLGLGTSIATRTWDELPTAAPGSPVTPMSGDAIFVGRLEERKGIRQLISAWTDVEKHLPGARLTIVGGGDLEEVVTTWCEVRPGSRSWAGEVEHAGVADLMAVHDVLVAPSVRWGRWREQIGLPIGEGLQAGLTVVTTDETGLAEWLTEHGHYVIPAELLSGKLAPILVRALRQPIPGEVVKNSLPTVGGRMAADHWLHGPLDPAKLNILTDASRGK
jgi:glycosyltransferase involved in cell wall biosynthesis